MRANQKIETRNSNLVSALLCGLGIPALAVLCALCVSAFSASVPPPLVSSKKPTAAGGSGGTIGPVSVAANADDGEIWTTFFWSDGEDVDGAGKMYFAGANEVWCFYRFVLPSGITSGATITSATLEINGINKVSWTDGTDDLVVTATDSGNASAPTTGGQRPSSDGGSTATTTAEVAWNNVTWSTSGFNSVSVATIIQELVNDNGGLSSSAGIVFWVAGTDNSEAHGELLEHSGTSPARLTIVWTP